ncbi:MAG: hypothetical protein ACKVXR_13750 [Planctomycetota bacterium]
MELADSRVPVLTERLPEPEAPPEVKPDEVTAAPPSDPGDPLTLPESSVDEMTRKLEAIRALLGERSTPILIEQFQAGIAEQVSKDNTWRSGSDPEAERTEIFGIHSSPNRVGTYKTVLLREQYPELYVLKDKTLRLDERIDAEKRRIRQVAAPPK